MHHGSFPADGGAFHPPHGGGRVPGCSNGSHVERLFERQMARRHLIERWLGALELGPGCVVADVGSGPGLASLMAARLVAPGGRVYAVDSSEEALAFLLKRWHEEREKEGDLAPVTPLLADAAVVQLPEPADALLITHLLHHVDSPVAVLRRCRQLLRPAGRAVVAEFDPQAPGQIGPPLERRISEAALRRWLTQAGWRVVGEVVRADEQYAWLLASEESGPGPATRLGCRAPDGTGR